eukprot:5973754-Alexandrium_andersonii.AAC.1
MLCATPIVRTAWTRVLPPTRCLILGAIGSPRGMRYASGADGEPELILQSAFTQAVPTVRQWQ